MNLLDLLGTVMLFAAAGVAVFLLPERTGWIAGVAMGSLGWLWLVVRSPARGELVARLKGFTWYRHTFCQHFLITGATGSGKTLSGILPLLFQVFKHQPRFGGLCVNPFTQPEIAEVFCRDSTFQTRDVDQGRIICPDLPQRYLSERRFVGTFLKLLFYTHALARFDAPRSERTKHNLLLLLADECQHFVTASEDGLSDHSVVDVIREAGVAVIAATQSTTSLVPVLGAEQSKVFTLNLRNRLSFTAADEADARASAEFLGKFTKRERSVTRGEGRRTETFSEREEFRVKPHDLRALRKHRCLLVHCTQGHRKVLLPPCESDGSVSRWFRRWSFSQ
jgi:type IV secretory pathway TraG/TraD family ATPase VirD4